MPPTDTPQRGPNDVLKRAQRLARLMDSSVRLPGGFRIGLDGLIGLVPGIGDLAAAGVAFYIVAQAARAGVPAQVIALMVIAVCPFLTTSVVRLPPAFFDILGYRLLFDRFVSDSSCSASSPGSRLS